MGEIFAKLEVYMWLGITKYAKNCVTSLPAEFRPIYEEATSGTLIPRNMPPTKLAVEGTLSNTNISDILHNLSGAALKSNIFPFG